MNPNPPHSDAITNLPTGGTEQVSLLLEAAEASFKAGDHLAAIDALQRALLILPLDFNLLLWLGNTQFHAHDLGGALASFTRASQCQPNNPLPHLSRASVLIEQENFAESEKAARLALDLAPGDVGAAKLLGRLLMRRHAHAEAAVVFAALLHHSPEDIDAGLALGCCRYELGDFEAARTLFAGVLQRDPANETAASNLAVLRKRQGTFTPPVSEALPTAVLSSAASAAPASIVRTISGDDEMYTGDTVHYFSVGESALRCIDAALLSVRRERQQIRDILDLPCGHGRVMRYLKAAFPAARITGCDLNQSAVDFCAATFGSTPVYSKVDVSQISLPYTYDLIWSGSLLTHLRPDMCSAFVRLWNQSLRPGGLLMFTLHGRWSERNLATGRHTYGLTDRAVTSLLAEYYESGFGYADYPHQNGYGISLTSPVYALSRLVASPDLRLVTYHEKGWDNHQDVLCFQKQPAAELLA